MASGSNRFAEQRIAGLYSRHFGQLATVLTPELEARILEATRRVPSDGSTYWSTRKLAARLEVSHIMVARVWRKHGLKPHRIERCMASNDPDFEKKAADIIGLYPNPPAHAAIYSIDEKTAIQALDRKDLVLPLFPGRLERHGFEYFRPARFPSTLRSTQTPARCLVRLPRTTLPPSSSPSSPTS